MAFIIRKKDGTFYECRFPVLGYEGVDFVYSGENKKIAYGDIDGIEVVAGKDTTWVLSVAPGKPQAKPKPKPEPQPA